VDGRSWTNLSHLRCALKEGDAVGVAAGAGDLRGIERAVVGRFGGVEGHGGKRRKDEGKLLQDRRTACRGCGRVGKRSARPAKTAFMAEIMDFESGLTFRGVPQVKGATPQVKGAAPQVKGATPQVKGATPQVKGATPQVKGATPQVKGATPQVKGVTPQTSGAAAQVKAVSPRVEGTAPQVESAPGSAGEMAGFLHAGPSASCAPGLLSEPWSRGALGEADMVAVLPGLPE
jgi:hypothetical protein